MKKTDIIIIGAGLSGLSCALKVQKAGKEYLLIDKADNIGGRVRSTFENEFIFDHGFQVYNTAYNYGKSILNYKDLHLCSFKPGAKIYHNSKFKIISDPFRDINQLYNTLISNISTLSDKLKILKMKFQLSNYHFSKEIENNQTTIDYLYDYGYSEDFIENFFRPFFGGVFLEKKLITSANFFKFVFSKFNSGIACIPKEGMQKIPDQIYQKLEPNCVILNTNIRTIKDNILVSKKGEKFKANKIIFSSNSQDVITKKKIEYNSVLCYYFVSNNIVEESDYIYLFPNEDLINNISILSSISNAYAPKDNTLFSVSIIGYHNNPEKIIKNLQNRLSIIFGCKPESYEYLKCFRITKGTLKQKSDYIFYNSKSINNYIISGEQTTNGSIDGAIESGLITAEKILN